MSWHLIICPFHTHTYSTKNSFPLLKHTNYCVNSSQNLYLCMHLCVCIYKFSSFWKAVKSSLKVTQQIQENILIGCCRSSLPKTVPQKEARADYKKPFSFLYTCVCRFHSFIPLCYRGLSIACTYATSTAVLSNLLENSKWWLLFALNSCVRHELRTILTSQKI